MSFEKRIKPTVHDIAIAKQDWTVTTVVSRAMRELSETHSDNLLRFAILEEHPGILGEMLYSLRTFLLKSTQTQKQTFSIQVPATWWDHLKQDLCHSRRLWVRRIGFPFAPPKYRTESKEFDVAYRLCPHSDSYLSEKPLEHIHWLTWEEDDARK